MLRGLHVHNFALIEDAAVEFSPGFNVFSGETGAGKSILIDAFGVALGARASSDYLRQGANSYWVQAVFASEEEGPVRELLAEQGIEAEEGELLLRRQVDAGGRGRAFVNGVQVPVAFLKSLGSLLVDIHGQHENQALLQKDSPLLCLDAAGGETVAALSGAYKKAYSRYQELKKQLLTLEKDGAARERLLDSCRWEIGEIKAAALKVGEEEALEKEARLWQNRERIATACGTAHAHLDREGTCLAHLAAAKQALTAAARYDAALEPHVQSMEEAWLTLEDVRQELGAYLEELDMDEGRAQQVQSRLDLIYRLQKKYGGSTEAVLAYLKAAEDRCEKLEKSEETIAAVKKELALCEADLLNKGKALGEARRKTAAVFSRQVLKEIADLALAQARFEVELEDAGTFLPTGMDKAVFKFSANLGEPLGELEKVASGGELSRLALAIKTCLRSVKGAATMVFDEIDSGVGGRTALSMAEKLSLLAGHGQVVCVTHLSQIAAFADRHIFIAKEARGGRTVTTLKVLERDERIAELARMAAGSEDSRAARETAAELLQRADKFKEAEK